MTAALELRGVEKRFGAVHALKGVDLTVLPGEVHGLLGENGSGKSTLIKILAGYHAPDSGELHVGGHEVRLPLHPGQFRHLGLSFVHQDLGLMPTLSVVENLRSYDLDSIGRPWRISWARERRRAREIFERYGLQLRPETAVADLSPTQRALLAIVRAVESMRGSVAEGHLAGGVLVLDEPTVFLPRSGTDQLFSLVKGIAAEGSTIVFVSHDLDEVLEITDRITILRDGSVVNTVATHEVRKHELVEMIVGRALAAFEPHPRDATQRTVAASVTGLAGSSLSEASFDLHRGEVVGAAGLVGSGFDDLPYLLYGAQRPTAGRLRIGERELELAGLSPAVAMDAGLVLIPGDRQRDGLIGSLSISDNVTMPRLPEFRTPAGLARGRIWSDADAICHEFDVRPPEANRAVSALSGGNQQKALLGKWLHARPQVLLLHEPTQGVDVGARLQIFELIRSVAAEGITALVASSDYEQLAAVCDRVLIFGLGRIVQELIGSDITKERITEQCYQSVILANAMARP